MQMSNNNYHVETSFFFLLKLTMTNTLDSNLQMKKNVHRYKV